MAVSRDFTSFVIYSEISRQMKVGWFLINLPLTLLHNFLLFQLWFSDTWAPDEHFIPTLVRITVDRHLHVIQVVSSISGHKAEVCKKYNYSDQAKNNT